MVALKVKFEALADGGYRDLAVVTADDRLILASGITPDDLPGFQGALVRQRLARGEIALDRNS